MTKAPTPEQVQALRTYAASHGRYWKRDLMLQWMNGTDWREREGNLLRQIRNDFGPSWLKAFNLEDYR